MFDYFYPFWQMYNFSPYNYICMNKPNEIMPFNLDNIKNNEQIVITESTEHKFVELQKYNPVLRQWETMLRKQYDKYSNIEIENGYWNSINKNVLIISSTAGSGGFLSYILIEYKKGKYNIIFEQNQIFQGDVWLENDNLFQRQGNIYSTIFNENGKFIIINQQQPIISGAKLIEYKINPSDKIILQKNKYYAHIGDIIQLIRKDNNNEYERILFSSRSNNIDIIKHRTAIKVLDSSPIEIEILPGYDWNKSKKINIFIK